jgi:hypothetical protein
VEQLSLRELHKEVIREGDNHPAFRDAPVVFLSNMGDEFSVGELVWDNENGFWVLSEADDE